MDRPIVDYATPQTPREGAGDGPPISALTAFGLIFGVIAVVFLIGGEFTFRTSRGGDESYGYLSATISVAAWLVALILNVLSLIRRRGLAEVWALAILAAYWVVILISTRSHGGIPW